MRRRLRARSDGSWSSPASMQRLLWSGGSLDRKPSQIGFAIIVQVSQSLRGTDGTPVAFSQTSSNSMRSVTIVG
jgi:hypothetical protein